MELLYLGNAANALAPFVKKSNHAFLQGVKPTLSPRDPNFIDWYDSYLAEMKKSEGPTPDEK